MFDHLGRKKQAWESINEGTKVLISQLDYNELGQVMTKHLHSENGSAPFLQDLPYTYNERGWLRTAGTSSNLFSLDLRYNTPDNGVSQHFNGNISEMLYTGTNSGAKVFQYQYDPLNRLTSAVSTGGTLNETVSYDVMGNITGLTRQGGSAALLAYSYLNGGLSDQLQVVTKGGGAYKSYAYDGNGNATSDGGSKGISYNLLNLPLNVTTGGTTLATYVYDAGGNKLRNTGTDGTWDYINGIVYNNNKILFVQTEEGRALPNGNTYLYQYYLKDHLGNTRVTFTKNSSGIATNIQENEYYAFGLAAAVQSTPSPANRYLYNGKEVQTDLTNQYDYGARFYDPVIGRFTTVDPLADQSESQSPYHAFSNNPINTLDPNGLIDLPEVVVTAQAPAPPSFPDLSALASILISQISSDNFNGQNASSPQLAPWNLTDDGKHPNQSRSGMHQPKPKPSESDLQKAFPGAKKVKSTNGRETWRMPDGSYLQWDKKKGEVEVYDRSGKIHKGGFDVNIPGKQNSPAVPGRTIYSSSSVDNFIPGPIVAPSLYPTPILGSPFELPIFQPIEIPIEIPILL